MLITLYLVDRKILSKPLLYLSSYFDRNKSHYYDNLTFVRSKNDMAQWLKYFLTGMADAAENAVTTLSRVIALKHELELYINQSYGRRSHSAVILLQQLFHNPVITIQRAKDVCQLSFKSANNLVADLVNEGILKEMTGQSRNRMFVFERYLDLFMKE